MSVSSTGALVFFAPNVHTGGGFVLLDALMRAWPQDVPCKAFLDARTRGKVVPPPHWTVHYCPPTVQGRFTAERRLAKVATGDDIVMCFHNLPPVFPVKSRVICYLQNPNLVGLVPSSHLSGWVRVRIAVERWIDRTFRHRIDTYLVQTPTMVRALRRWLGETTHAAPNIVVAPFIDPATLPRLRQADEMPREWDFIYVSDGTAHKNHRRLIAAWKLLADEGIRPSLALTLPDRDASLIAEIEALIRQHGLAVFNLGFVPHAEVLKAYHRAGALMFASYAESFGIPLLEARSINLPIIAAELDFVRDMCSPAETFDPFSDVSIARAVKRHLGLDGDIVEPMQPGDLIEFLVRIKEGSAGADSGKIEHGNQHAAR